MINTIMIKQQQLEKGFYTVGSGPEHILVMGSCRVVNIVTYLNDWNNANGNRFTIHSIDPFNFNWNHREERTDYDQALQKMETHEGLLKMLSRVEIFIHEYYSNAGMFNCNKDENKTIYKFGMSPQMDICIPNWNDYFVLFGDIVSFDISIRKMAIQDYNVNGKLSTELQSSIYSKGIAALQKFYQVCAKSDFPEMETFFQNNMQKTRLFWNYNHTTSYFTLALFDMMNDKYLKLDLSRHDRNHMDIFANNYTHLSEYDRAWYNFQWDENIVPLKNKLF